MGKRKHLMAERLKEERKNIAIAKLNDVPSSPQKMALLCDNIRGMEVNRAMDVLKYTKREAAGRLGKLVKSAVAVWESKNEADRKELENGNVIIKTIHVGQGTMIKRIRTAPQGRAARILKRSNHVTIVLDVKESAKAVKPVESKEE